MSPLQATVDLGVMAMKGFSVFPKAPALLESHHQSYSSAEKQLVYSTAPADWTSRILLFL